MNLIPLCCCLSQTSISFGLGKDQAVNSHTTENFPIISELQYFLSDNYWEHPELDHLQFSICNLLLFSAKGRERGKTGWSLSQCDPTHKTLCSSSPPTASCVLPTVKKVQIIWRPLPGPCLEYADCVLDLGHLFFREGERELNVGVRQR